MMDRESKVSGRGGWVMTEGQWASRVSFFLNEEGGTESRCHGEPSALSMGLWADKEKTQREGLDHFINHLCAPNFSPAFLPVYIYVQIRS